MKRAIFCTVSAVLAVQLLCGFIEAAPRARLKAKPSASPSVSPSPSISVSPLPVKGSREDGDRLFRLRNNEEDAKAAFETYKALYLANPKDNENVWRYSVALYHMGFKVEKDDKKKRAFFDEGKKITEIAIQNDPNCAACYFWHAIHSALDANEGSKVNLLVNINYVRKFAIKSTELDPTCTKAGGYRLLGQVEIGLPGILGGSNRRAKEYFEKAIAALPEEPLNYMELVKHLDQNMDEPQEAIAWAKKGAALKKPEAYDFESLEAWNELRSFLEKRNIPVPAEKTYLEGPPKS